MPSWTSCLGVLCPLGHGLCAVLLRAVVYLAGRAPIGRLEECGLPPRSCIPLRSPTAVSRAAGGPGQEAADGWAVSALAGR